MNPRILIVGDSFCSPNGEKHSWHNQLKQQYDITNLGQNGASQYKIHQQLMSVNVDLYDAVLLLLTSPYRIYVESNPFYQNHNTHSKSDLLYTDVFNKEPSVARDHIVWWFENVFDLEAAIFHQISTITWDAEHLKKHNKMFYLVDFFEIMHLGYPIVSMFDIRSEYPGHINHMSEQGHNQVHQRLQSLIDC